MNYPLNGVWPVIETEVGELLILLKTGEGG